MTTLTEKPDFERWVRSLQSLVASGIATPAATVTRLPKLPRPARVKKRTA
jgi:hypothetical protein